MDANPDRDHDTIEVIRSEEELVITPRRRAIERLRLRRVIVTEEVLLKVPVRHEELRVERLPADGEVGADDFTASGDGVVHRMVLRDEVPEVVIRVVPREEVRVIVTSEVAASEISMDLRREVVDVDVPEALQPTSSNQEEHDV